MKQRFESSSGMMIGTIIAVLAVAAAIVLAVVFSRKKCPACVCTELMGTLGKKCINDKGNLMCMDGSVCLKVTDNEGVCVKCTVDSKTGSDTCSSSGKVCNTTTGKCDNVELMGTLGNKCINDKGDLKCIDGSVCSGNYCTKCVVDSRLGIDTCGKGGKCNTDTGKCVFNPASGGIMPPISPMQK